jgi:hypothetical protein
MSNEWTTVGSEVSGKSAALIVILIVAIPSFLGIGYWWRDSLPATIDRYDDGVADGTNIGYDYGFGNGSLYGYQNGLGNGTETGYIDGFGNGSIYGYNNGLGNGTTTLDGLTQATLRFLATDDVSFNWMYNSTFTNDTVPINYTILIEMVDYSTTGSVMTFFHNLSSWYYNSTGNSVVENMPDTTAFMTSLQEGGLESSSVNYITLRCINGVMQPINKTIYSPEIENEIFMINKITYTVNSSDSIETYFTDRSYTGTNEFNAEDKGTTYLTNFVFVPSPQSQFMTLMENLVYAGAEENITMGDYIEETFIPSLLDGRTPISFKNMADNDVIELQLGNMTYCEETEQVSLDVFNNGIHYTQYSNYTYSIIE